MNAGDRLVCVLPSDLGKGTVFVGWPLHITIVPWFRVAIENDDLAKGIGSALAGVKQFEVAMGESGVHFGHQKSKLATLVKLPTPLIEIERMVRVYLHGHHAWLVDETTRQKRDFSPHVTDQQSEYMRSDDSFNVNCIYVIEQLGGRKQVVGKVSLT